MCEAIVLSYSQCTWYGSIYTSALIAIAVVTYNGVARALKIPGHTRLGCWFNTASNQGSVCQWTCSLSIVANV